MANWPVTLPQSPLIDGFSRTLRKHKQSFEPEGGKSKDVLFFTAVPEIMSVSFNVDKAQYDTLQTFYKVTTLFGTQYFTFADPHTGSNINVRFIGDGITYTPISDRHYRADFNLETLP
jgi:hypothetical protein